jgi:predicted nucleic acid-binding protein
MSKYLLDTNVISELRKGGRADSRVQDWASTKDPDSFYLSAITLFEIAAGANHLRGKGDEGGAQVFETWMSAVLIPKFGERLLSITPNICLGAATLLGTKGQSSPDLLIAATAKEHGCILVTRNVKDFLAFNLETENPFGPA